MGGERIQLYGRCHQNTLGGSKTMECTGFIEPAPRTSSDLLAIDAEGAGHRR
jgi:hypothetical protein